MTQKTLRLIEAAITAVSLAASAFKEWKSQKQKTNSKAARKPGRKKARKVVKKKARSLRSLPAEKALRHMAQTKQDLTNMAKEVKRGVPKNEPV